MPDEGGGGLRLRAFIKLLAYAPNITYIRLNGFDKPKTLYAELLKLHSQGHVQHLQYLPNLKANVSAKRTNLYNSTALSMKKTLTRVITV